MSASSKNPIESSLSLDYLYQEIIVDHSKNPRFKYKPSQCLFCQEGKNPLCGDTITLYCQRGSGPKSDQTLDFFFEGQGCSISQASASMMCDALRNTDFEQAQKTLRHAEGIYTGRIQGNSKDVEEDLEALRGVSQFPVRVKCAALPWKTLELLLKENFTPDGKPLAGCDKVNYCALNQTKKLKIVSTE